MEKINCESCVKRIAEELNISEKEVFELCKQGQIPKDTYKIVDKGTVWETYLFDVEKVLEALKPQAPPEEISEPIKPKRTYKRGKKNE